MNHRLMLLAIVAGVSAPPAAAQQFDRRSRDEPEIVVEAGGRVGVCDVLLFDRDGRFLFAGGDDKVVRVWPYTAAGLETDRAKAQVLRWRAWREQRGGVKAVAVSADAKQVAVGGYGMKPATVAVLDRETGDLLALTWPRSRLGDSFNAVTAVAFRPDGKRVGFGTADGSLWVWTPDRQAPDREGRPAVTPRWVGKHAPLLKPDRKPEDFNIPRLVYFRDADTLVSVAQSGEVVACGLTGQLPEVPFEPSPAKKLFDVNDGQPRPYRVYRSLLAPDGKWLVAASAGPQVLLRSTDGKTALRLPLPDDHFPRSIAVDPRTGRLAVGVGRALPAPADGKPRFFAEGNDEVWVYDDPTKGGDPKPAAKFPHRGSAEALAFHPTEDRLAVAGGDADEVKLLDLAAPEKPKPISVVRGAGRRPWAVNLSENGKVLGIQTGRADRAADPNRRGAGEWTRFEVPRLTPTLDRSQQWVDPVPEADGWSVVPDEADRFVWYATRPGLKLRLGLNRNTDLAPTCYTFLPAAGGKPTRLIVGHYYGCSLFELTPDRAAGGVLAPRKVYTGHAGEVLSVVAAKDQTWFVTGGADQTVAAWSLADWRHEAGLGAGFEVRNGRVEVVGVHTGSPAWEAGLRAGDVVELLAVGGMKPPVYDRRPANVRADDEMWGNPGTPEGAVAALRNPRPRVELYLGLAPSATAPRRATLTTVRQRPLWKWFPAFDDRDRLTDWVIWMWQGSYYHTKSAHGDRLVGWHVNHPEPGGRPEFYQLQQFERQFHRLDVLEKLVNTLDPAAALTDALGENPVPVPFTKYEPAPVRLAVGQLVAGPNGVPLTVNVNPRGKNLDLLPERVELWVNDHRLETWPKPGGPPLDPRAPFAQPVTIPAGALRAGENQVTVLTFNPAGGRAEDARVVTSPRPAGTPELLGLAVGINDYTAHRKNAGGIRAFGNLKGATLDAQKLTDRLSEYSGPRKFFRDGRVEVRLDRNATRAQVTAALTAAARATPDDLVVVFFAGHGDLLDPGNVAAAWPGGGRGAVAGLGRFVFCCPDYTPTKPADTAVSADDLFEALARVNCRKVVLLDACHSGEAADANVLRRLIPAGQGPFVIAACDQSEQSREHPKADHGLFTYAVLDALGPRYRAADADSDGTITPEELYDYVAVEVPNLMKQFYPGDAQNPICFPRQPPRFPLVKK